MICFPISVTILPLCPNPSPICHNATARASPTTTITNRSTSFIMSYSCLVSVPTTSMLTSAARTSNQVRPVSSKLVVSLFAAYPRPSLADRLVSMLLAPPLRSCCCRRSGYLRGRLCTQSRRSAAGKSSMPSAGSRCASGRIPGRSRELAQWSSVTNLPVG